MDSREKLCLEAIDKIREIKKRAEIINQAITDNNFKLARFLNTELTVELDTLQSFIRFDLQISSFDHIVKKFKK